MRWYVGDYNGILQPLKDKIGPQHLATPRDADVWVVFQDCQGSYEDLIKWQKKLGINKPVYTVQHGRGSTTDYGEPNKMTSHGDKYLCWGQNDYDRLVSLGLGHKAVIVGCPLNKFILPKVPHKEKVVLFIPVNTGKEEPENIAVYYELLKLKYQQAQLIMLENRKTLKKKWNFNGKPNLSFNDLSINFDVITKLLPWHDKGLYHGNSIIGFQDMPKNNQMLFNLLRNVDLVIGMDFGTTEAFAIGHDVPVVVCDIFKYHQHPDGVHPVEIEGYKTKAEVHCTLDNLHTTIMSELANPDHLKKERKEVAELELGTSYGDATTNIYNFIRNDVKTKNLSYSR